MAIVYDGVVTPDDLIDFVREVPTPAEFMLDQILPNVYIDSNEVDVTELTRTNRTARFRAFDANLHRARRDVGTLRTVTLPPLSDTLTMGEYERLKIQFARTGGTRTEALTQAVYNDAQTLTGYVINRMEQARGDVLTDGKFSLINEGGLTLEADFQVPAGNFVTAAVLHSHTDTDGNYDADVLGDIFTWTKAYTATAGFAPGGMWVSIDTLALWLANIKLRNAAGNLLGPAAFLAREQLDQALRARGLPPIEGVYDAQVDVDDVSVRITPVNKVYFVPPKTHQLGRTVWGVSATALELVDSSEADFAFENAPGIVGVVEKVGPPYREFTFVDAVGMPIIDRPRALMVATVA
ncbi:major capsid protein [Nocardioides sp.]|uniref:major capsid protein n=1 Tax=Nocardioides sp. TaxID=35761 RepID=UPI00260CB925|nr:major capsid protein [Nocardioides sp.]